MPPEQSTAGHHGSKLRKKSISPWLSFQDNLQASELRRGRRLHGLQLPLHPLQFIGWIALLGFGLSSFLVLVPALVPEFQQPLLGALSGLYAVHIVSHLAALLIDPADLELRKQRCDRIVPEFDRNKHSHVIENGRCHLCNIKTTSVRTKHCSVCNKCVGKFDHHCKWLNHCVGARNYVAFLMCVVSAVVTGLVILAAVITEIVFYYVRPEWLTIWSADVVLSDADKEPIDVNEIPSQTFNDSFVAPDTTVDSVILNVTDVASTVAATVAAAAEGIGLHDTVFLIFIAVLGILAAVTVGLLLHLCFFHVYISFLGLTTYEYIRNQRPNVMSTTAPTTTAQSRPNTVSNTGVTIGNLIGPSTNTTIAKKSDPNSQLYFCSTISPATLVESNELTKHRPKSLYCCDNTHEYHHKTSHKAFYVCSMLEESSTTKAYGDSPRKNCESRTFHCCSEYKQMVESQTSTSNGHQLDITEVSTASSVPTSNDEAYVQYSEQCTFCSFKMNAVNKSEAMTSLQDKRCCLKTITKHHRWKRKWNCCSSVPDSPDVPPGEAIRTVSDAVQSNASDRSQQIHNSFSPYQIPKEYKNGTNNGRSPVTIIPSPSLKAGRPRLARPWPVVRFRHMLRMIGRYRRPHCRHAAAAPPPTACVKQNQVRPLSATEQFHRSDSLSPTPTINMRDDLSAGLVLPPHLPPPPRRKIRNPTDLQELADSLTFVQQPRYPITTRRQRRKNVLRNRSPTLSPIHESGLSNPTSPQPCRHSNCTVAIPVLTKANVCGTTIYADTSP